MLCEQRTSAPSRAAFTRSGLIPNRNGPIPANGSITHRARSPSGFLVHQLTGTSPIAPSSPGAACRDLVGHPTRAL
ncbi:hypothetical protein GCM10009663_45620 [Kitasatospora arboriphila]|uniref:Uncharacterized protein n=1 Tax=Kitasatospora arboriphila TaxID=258052 RepID=A0ABP4E854_9ACTN